MASSQSPSSDLRPLPLSGGRLVLIGFVVLAAVVVATQNRVVGFEPGYNELQPKHHGWVSSHTLAIIRHATGANAFVGYAEATVGQDGQTDFDYFDRYPVFFSASMSVLLSLTSRISSQVYLAKQAMNGIFLLTVAVSFLLVRKLTGNPLAAGAIAVASMSSPYLLFYKDMVHYDQPALLGVMIVIYGIAAFKIDGRRRLVYPAALVGVSLGRGYASFAVLGTWLVLEAAAVMLEKSREAGLGRRLARLTALRVLALAVLWGTIFLGYNIAVEAIRREVPPLETSIVLSARNRLALNEEFNESYLRILNWRTFVADQAIRIVRWSFPVWEYEVSAGWSALLVAAVFGAIGLGGARLNPARRQILLLMALSGPIWLFGLRNLSAFHDYTAMYYIGIPLAFYTALAIRLPLPRHLWLALAALALGVFAVRNAQIQRLHERIGRPYDGYTHDFMRIAAALPAGGQLIEIRDGVPFAPYAPGFYLPEAFQAPGALASYVITRDRRYPATLLTPENTHLFLFEP